MGATAAAPVSGINRRRGNISSMFYIYWYDTSYPNGQYSGYQDMLPSNIYGIPYKIGNKHIQAARFLNTSLSCTKYIVIITGMKKKMLIKEIHNSASVSRIYIIKPFAEKTQRWSDAYSKVTVYKTFPQLVNELKQILNPLTPLNEIKIDMKTAIEYMAHPNPITMLQQTVCALQDEKQQQDDQLLYKTLYCLTLQSMYNKYTSSDLSKIPQQDALNCALCFRDSKPQKISKSNDKSSYLTLLKFAIRLDQYPFIVSGLSIPEVWEVMQLDAGETNQIIKISELLNKINPDLPLRFIDSLLITEFHKNILEYLNISITTKYGYKWKSLYYLAMCLADLDFCVKYFIQNILDIAELSAREAIHSEFAATLSQASVSSDIRISIFNDILERTNEPKPEEKQLCLTQPELGYAKKSCNVNDVLIFDINTHENHDVLMPIIPLLKSHDFSVKVYKLAQDFYTDIEAHAQLQNKIVFAVVAAGFPRLEYEKLLNAFIRESITPILIIYAPDAINKEISKAMFKNKWIITTVYAETFENIVSYISQSEIDIGKEMIYFSKIYANFSQTLAKFNESDTSCQLSVENSGEFDMGFEILNEINKEVFSGLVEELSLGNKLIGSLHYYMWKEFKEAHQEKVYWENYASLFAICNKQMNILDVNFGKNILRAYTLQTTPPFYKMLNDAFRGGNPAKISKYRGFYVILHDLIKKGILKYHTGNVYRGTYFNPAVLKSLKVGQKVFSTCFTSTSKAESVARAFARKAKRNVLLEIELHPRGFSNVDIHIENVSRYPEEQEVLLLPFTSFEIMSFSEEESLTVISLKEVLQEFDIANLKGIDYEN